MTSKEAAQKWVAGFNAIQRGMIEKLIVLEPESWHEVTVPAVGDRVYVYSESESGGLSHVKSNFSSNLMTAKSYSLRKMISKLNVITNSLCGEQCGALMIHLTGIGWKKMKAKN